MDAFELELVTELPVEAPARAVWTVLTDGEAWPRWCGPVLRMHAVPEQWTPGARLAYTLSMGPGVPVRFDVRLTEVEPDRRLAWTSRKWWGVTATRTFELRQVDGITRIADRKRFQSPWWPIGRVYPRAAIRRMSERWLADLAREVGRRAEAPSTG